jgi:hypothetical protein
MYRLFENVNFGVDPPPLPFGKSLHFDFFLDSSLTSTVLLLINRRLHIDNREMKTTYWVREGYHVENVVLRYFFCFFKKGAGLHHKPKN